MDLPGEPSLGSGAVVLPCLAAEVGYISFMIRWCQLHDMSDSRSTHIAPSVLTILRRPLPALNGGARVFSTGNRLILRRITAESSVTGSGRVARHRAFEIA